MTRTYEEGPEADVDRAIGVRDSFLLLTRNRGLTHRIALAFGARSAIQAEKALRASELNVRRVSAMSDAHRAAFGRICHERS